MSGLRCRCLKWSDAKGCCLKREPDPPAEPEVTQAMLDAAWEAARNSPQETYSPGLYVNQEMSQIDGVIDMAAIIRAALRAQK
jgi:hypothetical protein